MTRRIDNYKNNNLSTISNKNRAEIDFPLEKIVKKKKKRTFHTISFAPNDRKSTCAPIFQIAPIEQFLTEPASKIGSKIGRKVDERDRT